MSVVSLARDKSFLAKLRKIYPPLALRPTGPPVVSSSYSEASYIGLAFDYLYRIALAHDRGFRHPHFLWEADCAPASMSPTDDSISTRVELGPELTRTLSSTQVGIGLARHLWSLNTLAHAKSLVADFHASGLITDDLIWTMFKVGYLDMVVRTGKSEAVDPTALEEPRPGAIAELRQLVELARAAPLLPRRMLYLSPALKADRVAGGASPDLFVDGWVAELKVVTSYGDAARWADQLVLYAALVSLGGFSLSRCDIWMTPGRSPLANALATMGGDPNTMNGPVNLRPRIEGIAVYFARHGQWVTMPLAEIVDAPRLNLVANLLCENYLRSKDPARVQQLRRSFSKKSYY